MELNQKKMAELFGVDVRTVNKHLSLIKAFRQESVSNQTDYKARNC